MPCFDDKDLLKWWSQLAKSSMRVSSHLPVIIALDVRDEVSTIRSLEKECGLSFSEAGIFRMVMELLCEQNQAMSRLSRYLDYLELRNCGFGMCYENREFIKTFEAVAQLLWIRLQRERLYTGDGQLIYSVDHMRSPHLVLRRLDSVYELLRKELDQDPQYRS
jgi:hypothetical protein